MHGTWGRERAPDRRDDLLAHVDGLYDLARYLTPDADEADDLVQETYVRALRGWSDFNRGTDVRAWLYRILRNAFIGRYRHERRHPRPAPYDTTEPPPEEGDAGAPPAAIEADQLGHVVSDEVEAALRSLTNDARTVILLDLEGFTETEAAAVLGCATGTIKSRLSRARAALRLKLADYSPRNGP